MMDGLKLNATSVALPLMVIKEKAEAGNTAVNEQLSDPPGGQKGRRLHARVQGDLGIAGRTWPDLQGERRC